MLQKKLRLAHSNFNSVLKDFEYLQQKNMFEDFSKEELELYLIAKKKLFEEIPLTKKETSVLNKENEYETTFTESLRDTEIRFLKWLRNEYFTWGKSEFILMVGHSNLIRGMLRYFENHTDASIEPISVPTGQPLLLELDGIDLIKKNFLGKEEWDSWSFEKEKTKLAV